MARAAKPDFNQAFAAPVGSGVSLRAVGVRHRPGGGTAAIDPAWSCSPLDAVSGWKLDLLITDFARFSNSETALLCEWQGAAMHGDLLVGTGGAREEIARLLEGGFVGRALHRLPPQRAAFEPLDRSSRDRIVRTGIPPRADRRITLGSRTRAAA